MKRSAKRVLVAFSAAVAGSAVWAGTAYAKADVTVRVTGPLAGARVELRREGQTGMAIVAKVPARASITFPGVADGKYFVDAVGPGVVGSLSRLVVATTPVRASLSLRAPKLDKARQVVGSFTPGRPLLVDAADAAGVKYRLFVPGDALAGAATITVTPLAASPAPGAAAGRGIRIDPAGLIFRRQAELTVTGGGAPLRRYDPASGAWLALARDVQAGEGRFVVVAPGLFAPAAPDIALRQATLAFAVAQRHLADAVLEAGLGGTGLKPMLAASGPAMRVLFNAFAESGCNVALDKRGYYVARAIPALMTLGKKSATIPVKRLKAAAGRCSSQARAVGATGCRGAETAQDGVARAEARDEYLTWAFRVAKAYGISGKPSQSTYGSCVGFSVQTAIKLHKQTITLLAYTCGDTVAGAWHGTVTISGKNVQGSSTQVDFDLKTDGSQVDFWPAGNLTGSDKAGPFTQKTWLTATAADVTLSGVISRGSTDAEKPTGTAKISPGTRLFAKQAPCGASALA